MECRRNPQLEGAGLALVGIILGALGILPGLFVAFLYAPILLALFASLLESVFGPFSGSG